MEEDVAVNSRPIPSDRFSRQEALHLAIDYAKSIDSPLNITHLAEEIRVYIEEGKVAGNGSV